MLAQRCLRSHIPLQDGLPTATRFTISKRRWRLQLYRSPIVSIKEFTTSDAKCGKIVDNGEHQFPPLTPPAPLYRRHYRLDKPFNARQRQRRVPDLDVVLERRLKNEADKKARAEAKEARKEAAKKAHEKQMKLRKEDNDGQKEARKEAHDKKMEDLKKAAEERKQKKKEAAEALKAANQAKAAAKKAAKKGSTDPLAIGKAALTARTVSEKDADAMAAQIQASVTPGAAGPHDNGLGIANEYIQKLEAKEAASAAPPRKALPPDPGADLAPKARYSGGRIKPTRSTKSAPAITKVQSSNDRPLRETLSGSSFPIAFSAKHESIVQQTLQGKYSIEWNQGRYFTAVDDQNNAKLIKLEQMDDLLRAPELEIGKADLKYRKRTQPWIVQPGGHFVPKDVVIFYDISKTSRSDSYAFQPALYEASIADGIFETAREAADRILESPAWPLGYPPSLGGNPFDDDIFKHEYGLDLWYPQSYDQRKAREYIKRQQGFIHAYHMFRQFFNAEAVRRLFPNTQPIVQKYLIEQLIGCDIIEDIAAFRTGLAMKHRHSGKLEPLRQALEPFLRQAARDVNLRLENFDLHETRRLMIHLTELYIFAGQRSPPNQLNNIQKSRAVVRGTLMSYIGARCLQTPQQAWDSPIAPAKYDPIFRWYYRVMVDIIFFHCYIAIRRIETIKDGLIKHWDPKASEKSERDDFWTQAPRLPEIMSHRGFLKQQFRDLIKLADQEPYVYEGSTLGTTAYYDEYENGKIEFPTDTVSRRPGTSGSKTTPDIKPSQFQWNAGLSPRFPQTTEAANPSTGEPEIDVLSMLSATTTSTIEPSEPPAEEEEEVEEEDLEDTWDVIAMLDEPPPQIFKGFPPPDPEPRKFDSPWKDSHNHGKGQHFVDELHASISRWQSDESRQGQQLEIARQEKWNAHIAKNRTVFEQYTTESHLATLINRRSGLLAEVAGAVKIDPEEKSQRPTKPKPKPKVPLSPETLAMTDEIRRLKKSVEKKGRQNMRKFEMLARIQAPPPKQKSQSPDAHPPSRPAVWPVGTEEPIEWKIDLDKLPEGLKDGIRNSDSHLDEEALLEIAEREKKKREAQGQTRSSTPGINPVEQPEPEKAGQEAISMEVESKEPEISKQPETRESREEAKLETRVEESPREQTNEKSEEPEKPGSKFQPISGIFSNFFKR